MAEKLDVGASFPEMEIAVTSGGSIRLPNGLDGRYKVILFYRGHWWPYCRRQLVGFNSLQAELNALDIGVFAASVDSIDRAKEVASDVYFPIGYRLTREQSEMVGSWHMSQRDAVQPSEFLLDATGKIVASSYSAGPIGRIDAADVVKLVKLYDSRR